MTLLALAAASAVLAAPAASRTVPPAISQAAAKVAWGPESEEELIRRLPKAELHLHLDGALSPELVKELAEAQGYAPLKDKSLAEIRALAVAAKPKDSLAEVLEVFKTIYPLLKTPAALERVAFELAAEAKRQNVRYLEARFAPALNAGPGLTAEKALEAVLKGLARGETGFGVKSGVLLCLLRPPLASRADNELMLELALRYKDRGVRGIDLAGNEAAAPLSDFRELFRKAKAGGLRTTAHAGEVPGSADLATALELGVDRLGHALRLSGNRALLDEVRDRRIPIEVNLTSNLRTGGVASYRKHPVKAFYRAGIPIALSTDDPGIFGIDLDGEYRLLRRELGFEPKDLIAVALQGAGAAFLPDEERAALRRAFEAETLALLKDLAARFPVR